MRRFGYGHLLHKQHAQSELEDGPIRSGADGEVRTPGLPLTRRQAIGFYMA